MPGSSVTPSSQSTTVGVATGPYTVSWSAPIGDTTPQSWTLSDGGAGGAFSPASPVSTLWGDATFSFTYQNSTPGTYTLTVTAGVGTPEASDGAFPASVTAIVTGGVLTGLLLTATLGAVVAATDLQLRLVAPFLRVDRGDVLPSLVAVSGQSVSMGLGALTAGPTLTGQGVSVIQGIVLGPNDAAALLSGISGNVAQGETIAVPTAAIAGQSAQAATGVVRGPGDVVATLNGVVAVVSIACQTNAIAEDAGGKRYTIFDSGGSHVVPAGTFLQTVNGLIDVTPPTELRFPIPANIIALGASVSLDYFAYYASWDYVAAGASVVGDIIWDPRITIDFDGLSAHETGAYRDNPVKPWLIDEFYPKGIFDAFGNLIGVNEGPFPVQQYRSYGHNVGYGLPYTGTISELFYNAQGSDLVFGAGIFNPYPPRALLYCAYIQFTVWGRGKQKEDFVRLSATTFDGCLNVAWIAEGWPGKLKHQVHLGPQLQIGTSDTGWQPVQTIETTKDCYSCGLVYLPEGRLYLNYNQANTNQQRYNDQLGTGDAADWSAKTAADADHISAGGTGQHQGWRHLAGANSVASGVTFDQCRDGRGAAWTAGTSAAGAGRGPLVGGAWLNNAYGLLYTQHSDGKIMYLSSGDPDSWPAGPGVDTGFVGNVCGMAEHPSGRLVGIRQMVAGGAITAIISDDSGSTWVAASGAVGISTNPPPAIVAVGDVLYVVYLVSDSPRFVASTDAGNTWI
ncbi:MAG TPA: hypothetical protein VNH18_15785 [Bryobacteraceae bacterium]|nr:hypothetical protein [Bryobacteraceae bacterium]